jgi:hypothetical protein
VARLRLINGDPQGARALRRAGHVVETGGLTPAALRALRARPRAAVVIDLSRAPAQGRDLGVWLRQRKATRSVPLVFVDGAPQKVAAVERLLPDAVYASWRGIRGAVRRALARPPVRPVVPGSVFAAYEGRPLARKLGIRPRTTVALVGAPRGFAPTLGALPEGVRLRRGAGGGDLTLWFVARRRDLERRIAALGRRAGTGGLWVIWPKRGATVPSDLTQAEVRRFGLAAGLVDYKVCAVDATWTGLRFARRR